MQIQFCSKKLSGVSKCGCIATYRSKFVTKFTDNDNIRWYLRCDKHKTTATAKKSCVESIPLDQQKQIIEIKTKLNRYIGKELYSTRERNKYPLTGKYIKDCGIMCLNQRNKWIYVYYYQIKDFELN